MVKLSRVDCRKGNKKGKAVADKKPAAPPPAKPPTEKPGHLAPDLGSPKSDRPTKVGGLGPKK